MGNSRFAILFAAVCLLAVRTATARDPVLPDPGDTYPSQLGLEWVDRTQAQHTINEVKLVITNWAFWGFGADLWPDYFTLEPTIRGSEFPRDSYINQLQSAQTWIGGIIGKDTLVTTAFCHDISAGWEWYPIAVNGWAIDTRSYLLPDRPGYEDAVSNQDIITRVVDSIIDSGVLDYLRKTPHMPMTLEVTQRTYAWAVDLADDFILFDVTVKNYGVDTIKNLYYGVMSRPSVGLLLDQSHAYAYTHNCVYGFVETIPSLYGCGIEDTVRMMWGANNDGDPVDGVFVDQIVYDEDAQQEWTKSATSAHGHFFLQYPREYGGERAKISYNWWSPYVDPPYNFGPRHRDDFRDFQTGGTGWPTGDANRYHVLSNGEIDYDVARISSISFLDPVWLAPPMEMVELAKVNGLPGAPNMLSVGPFMLPPGYSVDIAHAFVCGRDFHTDPDNIANLPSNIEAYYAGLDFSDLFESASWARRVYDNPGIDTDGDEYAGEFTVCDGDTIYYTGDGVPDWNVTQPPPAPYFRLEPAVNAIRIIFNGTRSENEKDIFSGIADFEGYRIYCGRDERASSMALVASYDRENFDKYIWTGDTSRLEFELANIPFTIDSLRCLYGGGSQPCLDSLFNPLSYTSSSPYKHPDFPDSIFYFVPHDFNASVMGVSTPITKVYPDEPDPSIYHPDSIPESAYTETGLFKYYEYEFTIENLMATVPYWVNVTAFDFGQPDAGIGGLETSVAVGSQSAYPMGALEAAEEGVGEVYIYPNPYRGDAGYRDNSFEGRLEDDRPDYRVRAIHFANLPPKCGIYIYSLDGDLVRKLEHDMDPSDPNHRHHTWNMITRNTQMVVTGLYYWVVEAEDGTTQMGKLVVIM